MYWEFAAILIGAMVLSLMLGVWQQGRYARSVNAMVAEYRGSDRLLVTGRGTGRLRGTIVMLVIDDVADQVIAARMLRGSTIFATVRPAPQLLGPVALLSDRAQDKQARKAIDMALSQLKATRARVNDRKVSAAALIAGGARRKVQR